MLSAKKNNQKASADPSDIFEEPRDHTGHVSIPDPKSAPQFSEQEQRQNKMYLKYRIDASKPSAFSSNPKAVDSNIVIDQAPKSDQNEITSKSLLCCFRCC